jgi:hypothetical protein
MHPGLTANLPFRRLDPLLGPTLHRLTTEKPHFLDQSLLGSVSLLEISLRVPHRAGDRLYPLPKLRMASKKRQKRFVTQFRRRHGGLPSLAESPTIARTTLNRTPLTRTSSSHFGLVHDGWGGMG